MSESKNINTPYDDVFRTLLNDCPELIIPVVNEAFKTKHKNTEKVILHANEHFVAQQGGKQDKIITDSNFNIGDASYQIECQSTEDGDMIIRVWGYGAQIALREASFDNENCALHLKFPNTAILYLRHKKSAPATTKVTVEFPGASCSYHVPNIKIKDYSIDDIFEKKLYFFIPFHIFAYESNFQRFETKQEELSELKKSYIDLFSRLNSCPYDEMTEYVKQTIKDLSKKVLEKISKKYKNIQKGLGDVMGGKILDYRAKDIKREGQLELLFDLVANKAISITTAAAQIRMPEEKFQEKYDEWDKKGV